MAILGLHDSPARQVCIQTKPHRPGISKINNHNGTNKTTNNPTMHPQNGQRTKLEPVNLSSGTLHSSRNSFPANTHIIYIYIYILHSAVVYTCDKS